MTSFAAHAVVVGVDTHKDAHVAVALSGLGARLGELSFATTGPELATVHRWAAAFGPVAAWGIEGTGSWGAGLARHLTAAGQEVLEVNRPDRRARRVLGGKSDPIDAEAAARAVLAGFAVATPKTGDGIIEIIRITRATRSSAVKARTAAMNQLKAMIVTAPPTLRDQLEPLTTAKLINRCTRLRATGDTIETAVRAQLRILAQRWRFLTTEINTHTRHLRRLVEQAAPELLAQHGVGPDTAAALLIAAGDNPHRLRSEAAFAALSGTNPIPASSGKTDRHRLNRGGDRQANAALHRIIVVRLASHPETRAYMAAHLNTNGSNKKHVMRCLKRYLARRLYPLILQAATTPNPANIAA